jgi:YD repeat-containing protein
MKNKSKKLFLLLTFIVILISGCTDKDKPGWDQILQCFQTYANDTRLCDANMKKYVTERDECNNICHKNFQTAINNYHGSVPVQAINIATNILNNCLKECDQVYQKHMAEIDNCRQEALTKATNCLNPPPPPDNNQCNAVIKTITVNGVTSTYNYESPGGQGRLVSIVRTMGNSVAYDYSMPGKIIEKTTNPSNPTVVITYTVNSSGYPISSDRGTGIPGTPFTYKYDNLGHLIESIDNSSTDTHTIIGENVTEEVRTGGNSPGTFYVTYTTYCNAFNRDGIFGKMSKNWLSKITGTFEDGSLFPTSDFAYVLDASGRVIKQTQTTNGNSTDLIFTYY